jgi:outer membrane protein, heavy metal efflux system
MRAARTSVVAYVSRLFISGSSCLRFTRHCVAVVVSALAASILYAQDANPASTPRVSFTLNDALQLARAEHPVLSAAGGRRRAIVGAARQEAALQNPQFEWRRENLGSPLLPDEFATAALPVDLYGRRFGLRTALRSTSARATADSVTAARGVEFDVARSYWRAAMSYALYDAAMTHRASIDSIATAEEERARQGAVAEGAAMRARLEADRGRLAEATARADAARAHGELARALAMPVSRVPRPTQVLQPKADGPLSLDDLLAMARARRPELKAASARVDEANAREFAERLALLPALGVQAGSKRTSGIQTGLVAIGFSLPFFDRNGGNRERARGDVLMALGEQRAAQAAIDADVMSAFEAYRVLLEASEATRATSLDAQGLNARGATVATIAATAYREGAISLFERLDIERLRSEIRSTAVRVAVDLHLARLELARAAGIEANDPMSIIRIR